MKKYKKIIIMIIIIILEIGFIYTQSHADEIVTEGSYQPGAVDDSFYGKGGTIIGLIRSIGVLVSVGVLAILGIKYMIGSAEERADYKKDMIPYIIGALLTFATSALIYPIYDIFN